MDIIRKIKNTVHSTLKEPIGILLVALFIGYLSLLMAFIAILVDSRHKSNSDWFLENFAVSESELKDIHSFYHTQEPLGTDFEKVIHDNLWNLYES